MKINILSGSEHHSSDVCMHEGNKLLYLGEGKFMDQNPQDLKLYK